MVLFELVAKLQMWTGFSREKGVEKGGHFWRWSFSGTHQRPLMNNTQPTNFLQRWNAIQYDLIPELKEEVGCLTPKLEKLIHILEWVRIEGFVEDAWFGVGHPPHVWPMPLWRKQSWGYQRQWACLSDCKWIGL
ncbi:hypothetical protein MGMO_130c00010 [Methyloglobulus morosus KoM1]|uniref:Uncharacterized protein n=1 Tax=Methyloglobulus morosus KoM1 TaxID=1116472 RepID=V5BPE6_9GAMM|nr:hypothetical protein MGMO_130c00010 [Methyloglobulus morosus KoM1]